MRLSSGRRALIVAGGMVALLLLQSTLLNRLTFWGVRPDLVLMVVGSVALVRGWGEGMLWGAAGGLLEDVFSSSLPGGHALAKCVTGFVLGLAEGQVFKENPLLPTLALFLGTMLEEVLFFLAAGAFGQISWAFLDAFSGVMIPTALVNACFAPFIYHYVAELYKQHGFGQRERSRL
ncbi:MAG TPA: rod shape-determining protein MreD [Firmicutes bacterium]|nr:rod shape-determining protein MreD [Bacillota bacterium]